MGHARCLPDFPAERPEAASAPAGGGELVGRGLETGCPRLMPRQTGPLCPPCPPRATSRV